MFKFHSHIVHSEPFPLHRAAAAGDGEAVNVLLKSIATDSPDEHGFTALHHAARAGNIEIMTFLLGHGADIHALNRNNNTPLHSAAYGNQPNAIRWLLEHSADKRMKNKDGDTPLHSAAWKGSNLSIEVLSDESCIDIPNIEGDTPLHLAAWNNQLDAVRALIRCKADLHTKNHDGNTPAKLAEIKGHASILEFFDEQESGVRLSC